MNAATLRFACRCGAMLVARVKAAGRPGRCPCCGAEVRPPTSEELSRRDTAPVEIVVPLPGDAGAAASDSNPVGGGDHGGDVRHADEEPGDDAPSARGVGTIRPAPTARLIECCARCRQPIETGDAGLLANPRAPTDARECPACGALHHGACWQAAGGCAEENCPSAGATAAPAADDATGREQPPPLPAAWPQPKTPARRFPLEHVVLALCALGVWLGLLTYGAPALLAGLAALACAARKNAANAWEVLSLAGLLAFVGFLAGLLLSAVYWGA